MRCQALAVALSIDGWSVRFVWTAETERFVSSTMKFPFESFSLARKDLAQELPTCDLLVVDHYDLDVTYETAARARAARLLVLDDLPNRAHDCDVLMDQTLGRTAADYSGLVPASCDVLAGTTYALLRPQFARRRQVAAPGGKIRKVVLTLGMTDPAQMIPQAIGAIRSALPESELVVIVSSCVPHLAEITQTAMRHGAQLKMDVADMAGVLVEADLVVAAAGSVVWEICSLARPMILMKAAPNQVGIIAAMEAAGAARVAEPDGLAAIVLDLAEDDVKRAMLAKSAGSICDGRGAFRVALALSPEKAADGVPVKLRPASMDDAMMVLSWQQEPAIRRYARNPAVPSKEEHMAWMESRLSDPNSIFSIVLHGEIPVGVLRLDRLAGRNPTAYEVSIYIDPSAHRNRLGKAALALARRLVPEVILEAYVHSDNAPSHALFVGAGYLSEGEYYRHYPIVMEAL